MKRTSNRTEAIPFCPTITATDEDFEDFQGFVNRLEKDEKVNYSGIVKVLRSL